MDVNFEWYKIFYYAAQSENFSEAARQLYITQSAVSQGIKNLENKLGVTLFDRNSRRARLTPEGKLLFSHISQAFNYIKTGEKKLAELHQLGTGEIRVGASDTVCKYYLIPYLREFNRRFPNIKIQVINRTSPQIVELLEKGSLDCGIITMPAPPPYGASSTVRCLSSVWSRMSHTRIVSRPSRCARPKMLSPKGPENIPGNSVKMSKTMTDNPFHKRPGMGSMMMRLRSRSTLRTNSRTAGMSAGCFPDRSTT